MVRIAVRTISLNVYKVQNPSMLRFIRDKYDLCLQSHELH